MQKPTTATGPTERTLSDRRRDVAQHRIPVDLAEEGAGALHLVRRIARLEVALMAIEQRRGDRDIAEIGKAVADRADVVVDPEDLLNHDDRPDRRARGLGAIAAQPVTIACRQLDLLSHRLLSRLGVTLRCSGRRWHDVRSGETRMHLAEFTEIGRGAIARLERRQGRCRCRSSRSRHGEGPAARPAAGSRARRAPRSDRRRSARCRCPTRSRPR